MIVAITGGTGFIGKRLAERHIGLGDTVRVLSRRSLKDTDLPESVEWFQGDLSQEKNLHAFVEGVDILYHCAGEIRDTSLMQAVHVTGTKLLIKAAAGKIGRWVQLSSTGAYGGHIRDGVITERTTLNPIGMYEVTKVESDLLVADASLNGAFDYVILRPSIVYGAKMPNQSLYALISMVRQGWFLFIGKPGSSANYIHVNNVVDALVLCGSLPQASKQVYNLSDYCSLEHFITIIANVLNCDAPSVRVPEVPVRALAKLLGWISGMPLTKSRVNALTTRVRFSSKKIELELGYRHSITIDDGLRDLVIYWNSISQS